MDERLGFIYPLGGYVFEGLAVDEELVAEFSWIPSKDGLFFSTSWFAPSIECRY